MRAARRRLVIDVCHPAEVHHFKHLYWELSKQGWTLLFVARDKDVTAALLRAYALPHVLFSQSRQGLLRKLMGLPREVWRFYRIVCRFRPTFLLSNLSLHSSWVAAFYRVTHIAFIDTEHRRILDYLTLPFAHVKLTPSAYKRQLGRQHFRYRGNHELAYLFPGRFRPRPEVLRMLGIRDGESYVVLRFVAWGAFHDVGLSGMSIDVKQQLIQEITKTRRVFISSESDVPEDLRKYQLNVPPEWIHDVLYYADAYIGEGGTMASEAACLGTPAVYVNALRLGYCEEEAAAGLLFYYAQVRPDNISEIARIRKTDEFRKRHAAFMRQQQDVTGMMVRFVQRFPRSLSPHVIASDPAGPGQVSASDPAVSLSRLMR